MQKHSHLIGLFGGTFDPIHYGHLRIALECCIAFDLDHVRFIPCKKPAHRQPPLATDQHRLAMVKLAIDTEKQFIADEVEFHLPEPSYMHSTLLQLRKTHPQNNTFCLILGLDAFNQFHTWYRYEEILEFTHIIVATRPQQTLPTHPVMQQLLATRQIQQPEELTQQPAGMIAMLPVTQLDIAASTIRQQLQTGLSARYLCPDAVLNYIDIQGLYRV